MTVSPMRVGEGVPLRRAGLALLVLLLGGPGLACAQGAETVCREVPGKKEPVCLPRMFHELAEGLNASIETTMAMAYMTPDFCLDTRKPKPKPQQTCRSVAGTNRLACEPVPVSEASVPGTWSASATPSLSLHLAYLAVLRKPGEGSGDAGALLGGMAGRRGSADMGLAYLQAALDSDLKAGNSRAVVNDRMMLAAAFIRSGDLSSAAEQITQAGQHAGDGETGAAVAANTGVLVAMQGDYAGAIGHLSSAAGQYGSLHKGGAELLAGAAQGCATNIPLADARRAVAARSARAGLELSLVNLGVVHSLLGQVDQALAYLNQAIELYPPPARRGGAAGMVAMAAVLQRAGRAADASRFVDEAVKSGPSLLLGLRSVHPAGMELRPEGGSSLAVTGGAPARAGSPAQGTSPDPRAMQAERSGQPEVALAAYRHAALVAEATGAADALRAALANLQRVSRVLRQNELAIYYGKRAVNEIQNQRAGLASLPRDVRRSFATSSRTVYEALISALLEAGRLGEAEHAMRLLGQDEVSEFASTRGNMPLNDAERALLAHDTAAAARWRRGAARREAALATKPGLRPLSSRQQIDQQYDMMVMFVLQSIAALQPMQDLSTALGRLVPRQGDAATDLFATQAAGIERLLKPLECDGVDIDPRLKPLRDRANDLRRRSATARAAVTPAATTQHRSEAQSPAPDPMVLMKCSQFEQVSAENTAAAPDERLTTDLRRSPGGLSAADLAATERSLHALAQQEPAARAAALHYVITDQGLHILAVTGAGREHRYVPIPRADLNEKADRFREALQARLADVPARAQSLYNLLIAPVAPFLERAGGISTLHLSLDGKLRYVPFAALRDGRTWLVERYALAIGNPSLPPPATSARSKYVAIFGASQAAPGGFRALPAVPQELDGVRPSFADGIVARDAAFTARALRDALRQRRYSVVHIASHFSLAPEGAAESFLVLGDGSRMSLQSIREELRFDGVELVTLSACDTGLDARSRFGQEFEGLSQILQGQGAASVMATLWQVADQSTSLFMQRYYQQRETRGLSRAQALREVQLAMIQGTVGNTAGPGGTAPGPSGATSKSGRSVEPMLLPSPSPVAEQPADPARPFARPYFWAPFVLSGEAH